MKKIAPRYPIYVPSKDRSDNCTTVDFLIRDKTPFFLVVEPSQVEKYKAKYGDKNMVVLPRDNMKLLGTRLWIREHSIANGFKRHWQIDDNIRCILRRFEGVRIRCNSGIALAICEDFVDRYSNVGVAGLNYDTFAPDGSVMPPYYVNTHVYSCSLINNELPFKWRLIYNDDTDLCLQVLAGGFCTVSFNAFLIGKKRTMTVKGGNTNQLYEGDGRLKMSKRLQEAWPYIVQTKRRFKRPQHVIRKNWKFFDTPLKLKPGIDLAKIKANDYGLKLVQVGTEIKSVHLKKLMTAQTKKNAGKK